MHKYQDTLYKNNQALLMQNSGKKIEIYLCWIEGHYKAGQGQYISHCSVDISNARRIYCILAR